MRGSVSFLTISVKDGTNPGLCVKIILEEHRCFRIFNNARYLTRFLVSYFRSRILNEVDYKVKDMKLDVDTELRCNFFFFKCKRAMKLVLDEFIRRFTTEYSELEPYVGELVNSNPNSVVQLNLFKVIDLGPQKKLPYWVYYFIENKNTLSPLCWDRRKILF